MGLSLYIQCVLSFVSAFNGPEVNGYPGTDRALFHQDIRIASLTTHGKAIQVEPAEFLIRLHVEVLYMVKHG
jgi:hypothetical protein